MSQYVSIRLQKYYRRYIYYKKGTEAFNEGFMGKRLNNDDWKTGFREAKSTCDFNNAIQTLEKNDDDYIRARDLLIEMHSHDRKVIKKIMNVIFEYDFDTRKDYLSDAREYYEENNN